MENQNRILRLPEVIKITGLPRSTIYLYIEKGEFPKQVQLTKRSVGWRSKEVQEFIDSREIAS